MKQAFLAISLLALAAFAVSCKPSAEATPPTTSQQIAKATKDTNHAAQDMKDYTFAQKDEFTQTMQSQLAEINTELDQLAAKIERSSDAVKAEAKPKLQTLRDQTARLNKQLDDVKNATESSWDSVKVGFQQAYESSKDGFQQARQWVSDKIAP